MIGAKGKKKHTRKLTYSIFCESNRHGDMDTQICQSLRGNKTDVTILINMPRQQSIKIGFRLQLEISGIL